MKIIEGFAAAKVALSRQIPTDITVSSSLRRRLKQMFGVNEPELVVKQIIDTVRQRGDAALYDYTRQIDGVKLDSLEITKKQVKNAYREVDDRLISAIKLAAERIRAFHTAQKKAVWRKATRPGLSQLIRPIERVGVYVPGGTAPLFSTVLMTAVPARVAGVKEVILTSPPGRNGQIHPLTLVATDIAGVDRVFVVGGAQAVAALAFGTESVPKVDKICGPGNLFVMLSKKMVYGVVGIDGLQGPSEVLIIADGSANPAYCASDLLAQAEHDPLASAILVTTSRKVAEAVNREVARQQKQLSRQGISAESLQSRGVITVVANRDEAIELANLYAPEHLCLLVKDPAYYLDRLTGAGCIVTGKKATVVLGDYVAGPNHVLPTGGTARFSSPLNVLDFLKLTNVIDTDKLNLVKLGKAAQIMALAEGLDAHARAISMRLED
ncbi:MAG: histidinol dehydrogenase [Chloroflexota bacterium]